MKDDHTWWKHGVIYQIYPRSFCDSNGDGVGDLRGIVGRLNYLADLEVDAIWLSPIFQSPMRDFGYDVSDYCAIDPVFGTMEDFDDLVRKAHNVGIRVILDLVMNHTSDRHPWFREARNRESRYRDFYIWHPGKRVLAIRRPPNNWRGALGGGAWQWDKESSEYYLHLFLREQPDLNWRNPDVERAMFQQAQFWLDRGVDGFRLDVINCVVKDPGLRSNPYRLRRAWPRRHDQQLHQRDRDQPEAHAMLRRFRALLDGYGETLLLGEIYGEEGIADPDASASYLGSGSDELHLAFELAEVSAPFNAASFRSILERWYRAVGEVGWPCHVLNNHDEPRSLSRICGGNAAKARVLAALLLTQRGTPVLYYGEEIGMRNGRIRRSQLQDPLGKRYWPFYGRDPQRTPMQWSAELNAGFSSAARTWLPVNNDYRSTNVACQQSDHSSLLSWYRDLIALRRDRKPLNRGDIRFLDSHRDVLAYSRSTDDEEIRVLLNFSSKTRPVPAECVGTAILSTHPASQETNLAPLEARILELTSQ